MGMLNDFVKKALTGLVKDEAEKRANTLDREYLKEKEIIGRGFTIPNEYQNFPVFDGAIIDLTTKKTDKYERCTMKYHNLSEDLVNNYRNKIINNGYEQATSVRYEKGNTYIIIDNNDDVLTLVYHIKF